MFEWLAGYPLERFANGTVELAVPVGTWLILLAGLAVGVAWALRYSRLVEGGMAWLLGGARFILLALLLFVLLDPHLITPSRESRDGGVAILMDTSASMQLPASAGETRFARQREVVDPRDGTLARALRARFSLRLVGVGQRPEMLHGALPGAALHGTANLAAAIDEVLATGAPPAAMVFVSDGGVRTDAATARALLRLRAAGVPLHTVHVGGQPPEIDIEVGPVEAPRRVLRGAEVRIAAPVSHHGLAGRTVEVRLEEDGLLVATRTVELDESGRTRVEFDYRAGIEGTRRLRVRVAGVEEEAVTSNNGRVALLEVHDGRLDILHFEAEPRFEVKFVRRALGPDDSLQLASVVRTAENKFYRLGVRSVDDMADGFPARAEDLFHYEVLIIGSVGADDLDARQQLAIRTFVERRGGGVLFLGGRRALGEGSLAGTSLEALLPVRLGEPAPGFRQRYSLVTTAAGRRHPVAALGLGVQGTAPFADMPPLTFINPIRELKPGATLLLGTADAGGKAAGLVGLAYQRFGRGNVAVMPVRDLWRWQMHSSVPLDDETHERTWRQLARWLGEAATDRLELDVWPTVAAPGEMLDIEVQALDSEWLPLGAERLSLSTTLAGGAVTTLSPQWEPLGEGLYRTRIPAPGAGLLGLTVSADSGDESPIHATTSVEVSALGTELVSLASGADTLANIAAQTGGMAVEADAAGTLPAHIEPRPAVHASVERLPLWNAPLWLVLALLAACVEWLARRHRGIA